MNNKTGARNVIASLQTDATTLSDIFEIHLAILYDTKSCWCKQEIKLLV